MDGREFLDVADSLLLDRRQAYVQTSIGRFYYSAYLEARSFCEAHLGFVRSANSREHQDVPALIGQLDPEIANELKWIRRYRNNADYDIHLSDETIRLQVQDARTVAYRIVAALDAHAERLLSVADTADGEAPEHPE